MAIESQIYFLMISFEKGKDAKSKFYGFPIAKIGMTYLVGQLAFSIVEMLLSGIAPAWIVIIVNVVIMALATIGCIAAEVMRDEIVRQDVQIKTDVNNMRELQSLSASLVGLCLDGELKKVLREVADEFKYSDPVSSDKTVASESELKVSMLEIQDALVDGDVDGVKTLCIKVKAGLAERNRLCKLSK